MSDLVDDSGYWKQRRAKIIANIKRQKGESKKLPIGAQPSESDIAKYRIEKLQQNSNLEDIEHRSNKDINKIFSDTDKKIAPMMEEHGKTLAMIEALKGHIMQRGVESDSSIPSATGAQMARYKNAMQAPETNDPLEETDYSRQVTAREMKDVVKAGAGPLPMGFIEGGDEDKFQAGLSEDSRRYSEAYKLAMARRRK